MQSQNKKYKRKRDIQIPFMVDEKERNQIYKRMNENGFNNFGAYARKMTLNGRIIRIQPDSIVDMVRLLSDATNTINQIARRVNETGNIYLADIDDLNKCYDKLSEQVDEILRRFSFAKKGKHAF